MRMNSRIPRRMRTAGAFAVLYVLLAIVFAVLSSRVVFGILVAVPVTISLALNYALVQSSWARQLGERGRLRLVAACWAFQTTLVTLEVMSGRRVPVWLSVPLALLCGGLAAIGYRLWRSPGRLTIEPSAKDDAAVRALAEADAQVLAASETAGRTRDDRPYADAIAGLHQVLTQHPGVPGGRFLLHGHRAQYLTFQAGVTSERIARAAPAERRMLEDRIRKLYDETEAELRAAVAAPPGAGRSPAREYAALGLHLCLGAEQGGPDRTTEGVRLLREALLSTPAVGPDAQARIQLDLATALVIRARLNDTPANRQDAEALLTILTGPASPVAGEARELRAELATEVHRG